MAKRKNTDTAAPSGQHCAWAGCAQPGDFRAPRSRSDLRNYQYLCEAHIKEFNKSWNYFEGMTQDEIYAYQRDATTGHRPTWRMDQLGKNADARMEEAFNRLFGEGTATPRPSAPPVSARNKDALAVLDLEHPSDKAKIKAQYRELAKKYHPDINRGNSRAEEIFKNITRAYQQLLAHYVEQ
ncbi:MAG: J domain-containing protein [Rickettsiales bacterium]